MVRTWNSFTIRSTLPGASRSPQDSLWRYPKAYHLPTDPRPGNGHPGFGAQPCHLPGHFLSALLASVGFMQHAVLPTLLQIPSAPTPRGTALGTRA